MATEKKTVWLNWEEVIIYLVWFLLVVVWNFGYPRATPAEDVLASVVFAVFSIATIRFKAHSN